MGDHCSNVAVAMIELESEQFDTHEYINNLREKRSEDFDWYYDSYKKRFTL
jgi:phosphate:Na+ symporter